MPRPIRNRRIENPPEIEGFHVIGGEEDCFIELLYEEFEALRLSDYLNLTQVEAAEQMNVSRPTFTRIYDRMLKKIAKSFVEGKSIRIEGGNVKFDKEWYRCKKCHKLSEDKEECPECNSNDQISINKKLKGFSSKCICGECGYEKEHERGVPCKTQICPNCNSRLSRKQ